MSTSTKFYLSFLVLILFSFGKNINAQNCPFPTSSESLNTNNLKGGILLNGTLFSNTQDAYFGPNLPQGFPQASVIFTSGLWLGAKNNSGDLKLSGGVYGSAYDYVAGPITNDNGQISYNCDFYDRLWMVMRSEILAHLADFEDNGVIDNPLDNIYDYPAQGNPFFENINGFSLPNTPQGLAPFFDQNNDGIYNPTDGDFPKPSAVDESAIPGQMIWGIFNDGGTPNNATQGEPLNAEIQITGWAYNCTDNEVLNNTLFTSHKIINRSNEDLDSLAVGFFMDFNMGCWTDDFMGSAPSLNTFYGYNADEVDGSTGCQCAGGATTFCQNPPVQAITLLNQEMNSFMYFTNESPGQNTISNSPNTPLHYYDFMHSKWKDGSPLTFGADGLQGSQATDFAFSDNPNDLTGWSMNTATPLNDDKSVLGSSHLGNFATGDVVNFDLAFTFYQDENLNHLEVVNLVYDNTPALQQIYDDHFVTSCEAITLNNENLSDLNIQIFPNPTSDILNIKMENQASAQLTIFDIYGKKVLEKMEVNQSEIQLSTSSFSQGVYFLRIEMEGKELVKKFIKM